MFGIFAANNKNPTLSANNFTIITSSFYRGMNFHWLNNLAALKIICHFYHFQHFAKTKPLPAVLPQGWLYVILPYFCYKTISPLG
jgi:hypothetical protein